MNHQIINDMVFNMIETPPSAAVSDVFGNDQYCFANVPNKGVVIDLGANVGAFTVRAAKEKNCCVYSYEACSRIFSLLEENVQNNKVATNVVLRHNAIANKKGTSEFYFYKDNPGGSSFWNLVPDRMEQECVDTVTLRDVFEDNTIKQCDFLKVDIEGAEIYVFIPEYIPYLIRCRWISFEFHCTNLHAICDLMVQHDFDCGDYKNVHIGGGTHTIKNRRLT